MMELYWICNNCGNDNIVALASACLYCGTRRSDVDTVFESPLFSNRPTAIRSETGPGVKPRRSNVSHRSKRIEPPTPTVSGTAPAEGRGERKSETISQASEKNEPIPQEEAYPIVQVDIGNRDTENVSHWFRSFTGLLFNRFLFYEKPPRENYVRIRWRCQCGYRGVDEYDTSNISVEDLCQRVRSHGPIVEATPEQSGEGAGVINALRNLTVNVGNGASETWKSIRRREGVLPNTSSQTSDPVQPISDADALFLLLCIAEGRGIVGQKRRRKHPLGLHHMRVEDVNSDGELFRRLSLKYRYARRLKWYSWHALREIRFVRFRVYRKQQVECVLGRDELPPRNHPYGEYIFEPIRCNGPPIGSIQMIHYLNNPEEVDYYQTCYKQCPKKQKTWLEWSEDPEERVGWGLLFVEGFHWGKAFTGLLVVVILGGLLFTVLYGYFENDYNTSLGAAQYTTGLAALAVAAWQGWALTETFVA